MSGSRWGRWGLAGTFAVALGVSVVGGAREHGWSAAAGPVVLAAGDGPGATDAASGAAGAAFEPALVAPSCPLDGPTLVSVASSGMQGNAGSLSSSIGSDDHLVAFDSVATNLVPGDGNSASDVFVRDLEIGTTARVSVGPGGTEGDGDSAHPAMTPDGRFVAFESSARNLVAGDGNGAMDVFVRDVRAGTTALASVASSGTQGDANSFAAAISADGRFVAFESGATTLAPGDSNGFGDVFVRDRLAGTTTRVSVGSSGAQANGPSGASAISADGRRVAFYSEATNLDLGDSSGAPHVFVHDLDSGTTTRVDVSSSGERGNGSANHPRFGAGGRLVAFDSLAANLVAGDTNGVSDVFVRDLVAGTTVRVSLDSAGAQGDDASVFPSLSADGRVAAFCSRAANLVPGDSNGTIDAFVRDLASATTRRASVDAAGGQANGLSGGPVLSGDGHALAFFSSAANLVAVDTNVASDVFVTCVGP